MCSYEDRKKDYEAIKAEFPFSVTRISLKRVDEEVGEWFSEFGENALIIDSYPLGPKVNFPPWVIIYGFKNEADAVAFKLKFP